MQLLLYARRAFLPLAAILSGVCGAFAATVAATPGSLRGQIDNPGAVTELTVSGTIDASDIFFIADEMTSLRTLDLSQATIAAYQGEMLHNHRTYPASTIPALSFAGSSITSLTLPAGRTMLADGAFAGAKLKALTLGANVTLSGSGVFADCPRLVSVTASGATLGDYAFMSCPALTRVVLDGTAALPEGAFQGCQALVQVSGSASVTAIGSRAFEGCTALESIDFGQTLTAMGQRAFAGSGLQAADLSNCQALAALPAWAFAGCTALEEAYMPEGMSAVGTGAFFGCTDLRYVAFSVTDIAPFTFKGAPLASTENPVPDGVRTIGAYALKDASGISHLALPAGLEYIGDGAMEGMTGLEEIEGSAMEEVPALGESVWAGLDQRSIILRLNPEVAPDFISAPQWMDFKIVANSTVVSNIDTEPRLSARFDGPTLLLRSSADAVGAVALYDTAGTLLAQHSIGSTEGAIDTSAFATNLFIITVARPDGNRAVLKLLR